MTPQVPLWRKALSVAMLAVLLFAAVVVQLTVVNRLPLPGVGQSSGAAPDLVLLLVAAIAVVTTPGLAALTGFAGGLALDIAPPAAHYAGAYALVFSLVGYGAARAYRAITNTTGVHDQATAFTVIAVAAAAGEAGKAALGMLLSDPDVTTAAVSRVLPSAILYDLLLAPLAGRLVARVTRAAVPGRVPAPDLSAEQPLGTVFRQASAGAVPHLRLVGTGMSFGSQPPRRVPRLRFSGTGGNYDRQPVAGRVPKLRFAGTGGNYDRQPVAGRVPKLRFAGTGESFGPQPLARRVPKLRLSGTGEKYGRQPVNGRASKLRLSGARASSVSRTAAAFSGGSQYSLTAGPARKLNFAGDLPVRRVGRQAHTPGKNWLRSMTSPALGTAQRSARAPARGWLGAGGPAAGRGAGGRTSRLAGVRIGRRMGDVVNGRARTGLAHQRKSARPQRFAGGTRRAARPGASLIAPRMPRTSAEALAARSAPSGLSALSGAGTPLAGGRSPQAGWLSGSRSPTAPAAAKTPRDGWLGSTRSRPRTVIGSVVGGRTVIGSGPGGRSRHRGALRGRGTRGGNWYTASPSGAWLRRGSHPWRKRSRRLLRMVGVGR